MAFSNSSRRKVAVECSNRLIGHFKQPHFLWQTVAGIRFIAPQPHCRQQPAYASPLPCLTSDQVLTITHELHIKRYILKELSFYSL